MINVYKILHDEPTVAAIVGGRIFRDWGGDEPTAPYVVWSLLSSNPDNNLTDRPPSDRHSVSVDCFALTERQSDALVAACRYAVEGVGQLSSGVQSLGREADTELWRYTFAVDIFRNR